MMAGNTFLSDQDPKLRSLSLIVETRTSNSQSRPSVDVQTFSTGSALQSHRRRSGRIGRSRAVLPTAEPHIADAGRRCPQIMSCLTGAGDSNGGRIDRQVWEKWVRSGIRSRKRL